MSEDGGILQTLFSPTVLPFVIPILAIIVGGVVVAVKQVARHQERMAMIERGIHPDSAEASTAADENAAGE